MWEGYTGAEATAFSHLISAYEKANPGVKISVLYVNNDNTLQKVLTAVRGGTAPDIAYLYGSWAPNVAQSPQVVNLTRGVNKPGVNWDDFWVGERDRQGTDQAGDQAVRHRLHDSWLGRHGLALGGPAVGPLADRS